MQGLNIWKKDALIEGKIGNAIVKVMNVSDLFDIGIEFLGKDTLLFICHNPSCNSCHWSRLLYNGVQIDYSRYKDNGCIDNVCEICVVE